MKNVFDAVPNDRHREFFETLVQSKCFRLERIVSNGQSSPEGFWYDQPQHEWVIVLAGAARLKFADQVELLHLEPGDYVGIPAGKRHRVEWTAPDETTVWLALFYDS